MTFLTAFAGCSTADGGGHAEGAGGSYGVAGIAGSAGASSSGGVSSASGGAQSDGVHAVVPAAGAGGGATGGTQGSGTGPTMSGGTSGGALGGSGGALGGGAGAQMVAGPSGGGGIVGAAGGGGTSGAAGRAQIGDAGDPEGACSSEILHAIEQSVGLNCGTPGDSCNDPSRPLTPCGGSTISCYCTITPIPVLDPTRFCHWIRLPCVDAGHAN